MKKFIVVMVIALSSNAFAARTGMKMSLEQFTPGSQSCEKRAEKTTHETYAKAAAVEGSTRGKAAAAKSVAN